MTNGGDRAPPPTGEAGPAPGTEPKAPGDKATDGEAPAEVVPAPPVEEVSEPEELRRASSG